MRLHELSITAFGPFADTVVVDFDALSESGLFLLAGPTGAGKTSVLDAVCFALYGVVPGDRHATKHLRSDHAAPQVAPEVSLRLSIGQRTFRFTRSPAWQRPKRRGIGEVTVPAHVVVEEEGPSGEGAGRLLTNRLDEAGDLVTRLLGMTSTQFTQVAMLPQGRFQAFLRANSAERQAVLQQLFQTERFEQIERWLVERRVALHRDSESAFAQVRTVVNRIEEAAGTRAPAEVSAGADDVVPDDLDDWARTLSEDAARARGSAETAAALAETSSREATAHRDDVRRLAASARRGRTALAELALLEASRAEAEVLTERLAAHRRAAPVLPLLRQADQSRAVAATHRRQLDEQLATTAALLGAVHGELDSQRLAAVRSETAGAMALIGSFLPKQTELARLRSLEAATEEAITTLGSAAAEIRGRLERTPQRRQQLRTQRSVASGQAAGATTAERERSAARSGLVAARRVHELEQRLAEAQVELTQAQLLVEQAKDTYQLAREARISSMAGELARGLASGCSCPVCGSAEHPAPARRGPVTGSVEEEGARDRLEAAQFEHQNRKEKVSNLQTEVSLARDVAQDVALPRWEERHASAQRAAARAEEAAQRLQALDAELEDLESIQESDSAELTSVDGNLAAARTEHASARGQADALSAELAQLLGGVRRASGTPAEPEPDLQHLLAQHEAIAAGIDRTLRTWHLVERHHAAAEVAAATAGEASQAADFTSASDVRGAILDRASSAAAEVSLTQRSEAKAAARATLAEPEVKDALTALADQHDAAADLDAWCADAETTRQARQEVRDSAVTTLEEHRSRTRRLEELTQALRRTLGDWRPLRERYAWVSNLAALTEGKSPDNPQRMRLSGYVLAERLAQVVAATNERLAAMTDQRFSLEPSEDRGAGEQRGGLSLRVRDGWNGTLRDPATLSGGETFVVSLALALGLADTVSHEAGGVDIDTLFIDEGFGSLDAETLDDVMDTLDTLREGGRVVGIVSHVGELRARIGAQLEIVKTPSGSALNLALH